MSLRVSTAPGSWGVEPPSGPGDPPWELVLDEIAAAGYDGTELGPYGYLPTDPAELTAALAERSLDLVGAFVMQPLHDRSRHDRILAEARATVELVAEAGARRLILIESLVPERSAYAGVQSSARDLPLAGWDALRRVIEQLMAIAEARDVTACFHPHAGTYVEFESEIERLMSETAVALCIDTGHSLFAGIDPAALALRYADRLVHVHLKDIHQAGLDSALRDRLTFEQAVAAGVFCRLGEGSVDFTTFRYALTRCNYDGWATVEQDRLASDDSAALNDARANVDHLRSIGLARKAPA